jgi:hypothetical protein
MFFSADRTRYNSLCAKYQVKAFPSLIVLSSSGKVLTSTGVQEIYNNSADAIRQWAKGNCFLFSCTSYKEKYVSDGVSCSLSDAQIVSIATENMGENKIKNEKNRQIVLFCIYFSSNQTCKNSKGIMCSLG